MSEHGATERLRALLDELALEYECDDQEETIYQDEQRETCWKGFNGLYFYFHEWVNSGDTQLRMVCEYCLTPEQAVDRTLGPGRCHISVHDNLAETDGMGDVWLECDACNWQMLLEPSTPRFNFCPNCGAEVVDE